MSNSKKPRSLESFVELIDAKGKYWYEEDGPAKSPLVKAIIDNSLTLEELERIVAVMRASGNST